jgi:hypothetical protein
VPLPPLSLTTPGQYVARMILTFAGAVLGASLAFFGIGPRVSDWIRGFSLPILILAGAMIGGWIGYWAGVMFGRLPMIARWTPLPASTPEEQAKKLRLDTWHYLFGCFGWPVGLFFGTGLFFGLKSLVLGPASRQWDSLLCPLLVFGGGVAGIICGLLVGIRVTGSYARVPPESTIQPDKS